MLSGFLLTVLTNKITRAFTISAPAVTFDTLKAFDMLGMLLLFSHLRLTEFLVDFQPLVNNFV